MFILNTYNKLYILIVVKITLNAQSYNFIINTGIYPIYMLASRNLFFLSCIHII
jgi:hypothetical protein